MEAIVQQSWKEEFAQAAALSRSRNYRLEEERHYEQMRRRHEEKIRQDDEREQSDDLDALMQQAMLATQEQITEFRGKLDRYDATVIELLMENEQAQEQTRASIDGMLAQAHTLPDGTRVFATEDGEQVFDEHGAEVTDTVAPEEIDPTRPHWEGYRDAVARGVALESERGELLEFQEQLDETRARLDEEGPTSEDLNEMRNALDAEMPEELRIRLRGSAPAGEPQPEADRQPDRRPDMTALRQGLSAVGSPAV